MKTELISFINNQKYLLELKVEKQRKPHKKSKSISSLSLLQYLQGQLEQLEEIKNTFTAPENIEIRSLISSLNELWEANYKAQELVVGPVNSTGQPHPEGSFFMGKMDGIVNVKNKAIALGKTPKVSAA